jgi:hypothetical protein
MKTARTVRTSWWVALVVTAVAPTATAQTAALLGGFGGPAGFGTNVVPTGDDGSSSEIDLRPLFPAGLSFDGVRYLSLWVNINGNVSFNGPLPNYTPTAFPGAPQPMVAAWWADVDTRPVDPPLAGEGIYWHLGASELVVTWNLVGYFDLHRDRRNSF